MYVVKPDCLCINGGLGCLFWSKMRKQHRRHAVYKKVSCPTSCLRLYSIIRLIGRLRSHSFCGPSSLRNCENYLFKNLLSSMFALQYRRAVPDSTVQYLKLYSKYKVQSNTCKRKAPPGSGTRCFVMSASLNFPAFEHTVTQCSTVMFLLG